MCTANRGCVGTATQDLPHVIVFVAFSFFSQVRGIAVNKLD